MSPDKQGSGRRDAFKVWGGAILLAAIALALTLPFVDAPPPTSIRLATGPESGAYFAAGQALAEHLAEAGIEVEVLATAGSAENLELLAADVDVAFLQGGVAAAASSDVDTVARLEGIASLYYEPLWIFTRAGLRLERLGELRGLNLEVGQPGSGTRFVVSELLRANEITMDASTRWSENDSEAAGDALLAGEADALFVVTSPRSALVRRLYEAVGSGALAAPSLDRAHAYSRHFPYLEALTLTPGMIDLAAQLPRAPVQMVAPTATLVAKQELHPSVVPLLIRAAEARFGAGGLFEEPGEFPSSRRLDVTPAAAALHYYAHGRSFLYRVLPFQVAAALDRLKILLLPLITLLIPLAKLASPLYRWRVRSRIIRWYQYLMRIDAAVRRTTAHEELERARTELNDIEDEISAVSVPLSYAEELYNLKMHLQLVQRDVDRRIDAS